MPTIAKDRLKELLNNNTLNEAERRITQLRLDYSEATTLLNHYIAKLSGTDRIYPQVRPTQKTGRYSTTNPPLTNFPKKCINPSCPQERHRKTEECWSLRDVIMPDEGEFWYDGDADAIEARIYALLLQWEHRIEEFNRNLDIHTPVTCNLFGITLPSNFETCHMDEENLNWRIVTQWQGKDDKRRTMSKNFTYGGQYFYVERSSRNIRPPNYRYKELIYNPEFVLGIPGINEYGLEVNELIKLAHKFVESNYEVQLRKADEMERIRKSKISRTLYGARRVFYQQSTETAKEGFNQQIQGTVVDYMNQTEIMLAKEFPTSHFIHNAHDGLKWAFDLKDQDKVMQSIKGITERPLRYKDHSIMITFTGRFIYNV